VIRINLNPSKFNFHDSCEVSISNGLAASKIRPFRRYQPQQV
jgi:hypothetical protein